MSRDPELVAMLRTQKALDDLDPGQRRRVIQWLLDRYSKALAEADAQRVAEKERGAA